MMKKREMNSFKQSKATKAYLAIERRYAVVEANFEALHMWTAAPETEAYLRNAHRHLFVVRVAIEVLHGNREIEYYNFKNWLQDKVNSMPKYLECSCEDYCDLIAAIIRIKYPRRAMQITVLEDGHEGAICQYH